MVLARSTLLRSTEQDTQYDRGRQRSLGHGHCYLLEGGAVSDEGMRRTHKESRRQTTAACSRVGSSTCTFGRAPCWARRCYAWDNVLTGTHDSMAGTTLYPSVELWTTGRVEERKSGRVGVRKRGNDSQTTWKSLPRPCFRRVRHLARLISDVQGVPSVDDHMSLARCVQHTVYVQYLTAEHGAQHWSSRQTSPRSHSHGQG